MTKEKAAAQAVEDDSLESTIDSTPEPKKEIEEVDELASLREQIEKERKDREAATARAEKAEQERAEINRRFEEEKAERTKAQSNSIDSMIAAAQADSERLEKEMDDALEKGDLLAYRKINTEHGKIQRGLERYEERKAEVKEFKPQQQPENKISAKSQQWLNEHPQFYTDQRYHAKTIGAHNLAISEGLQADSEEYFQYINNIVEPKKTPEKEESQKEETPKGRASTATPPSRGASSGGQQRGSVRLTPEEVEHAMTCFPKMSPADAQKLWYENRQELIKLGKL